MEGFEAILYPGNGRKDKVMIVMSGSNGGMKLTKQEAEFYHRNGIPSLALALFKTKQTPKELSRVPLSGSGKNKAPSGTSCWSYRGRELPYAPYRSRTFNILQMFMREKEMHIITFNRDKDITPETLIPIENIKAPILMLSSKHDEVWPSYESAVYMEKKLTEIGFPYTHKHIAYEHMSHAVLTRLPWIYKMAFKSERRHLKECAKDRDALKNELLDWVNADW